MLNHCNNHCNNHQKEGSTVSRLRLSSIPHNLAARHRKSTDEELITAIFVEEGLLNPDDPDHDHYDDPDHYNDYFETHDIKSHRQPEPALDRKSLLLFGLLVFVAGVALGVLLATGNLGENRVTQIPAPVIFTPEQIAPDTGQLETK